MKRLLDLLWLLFLGIFIARGIPIVSFHGDESNHIKNSKDYAILFIEHHPLDLLVHDLWESRDSYQRLLDSGVSRYTIGLAWHLAGLTSDDLPTWDYEWHESYDQNVARGSVPSQDKLVIYRIPSALFTALSVGIVFLIGKLYGGRALAYFASGLYVLNPIILLNGRRALQEGSLLFFGLLTVYAALKIAQKRERGLAVPLRWWICLVIAGALTQYSKNTGFIYIVPAYLAILVPEVLSLRLRAVAAIAIRLALCTVLTLVFFFAISPGMWYDPLARISDVINGRLDVMASQVLFDPAAPTGHVRRLLDIAREPFMTPLQQYEVEPRILSPALSMQIDRYMRSPLSGLQFDIILGGLLSLLTLFGLFVNAIPRLRFHKSWALASGLYLWLAVNIGVLFLLNPLPWQRYYASEIPVVTIFAGMGFFSLVAWCWRQVHTRMVNAQAPA